MMHWVTNVQFFLIIVTPLMQLTFYVVYKLRLQLWLEAMF